jgi:hypothetical protein
MFQKYSFSNHIYLLKLIILVDYFYNKMFNITYLEKLNDIRWKAKSLQIKKRDNNKCRNCGDKTKLNVHHRQYHFIIKLNQFKNPWDYPDDILITLCNNCHQTGHKFFQIPIIKI